MAILAEKWSKANILLTYFYSSHPYSLYDQTWRKLSFTKTATENKLDKKAKAI